MLEGFIRKRLRLKVNRDKSAVARPWERRFPGYTVTSNLHPRLKVAPQSVKRLRAKLQPVWRRGRGQSLTSTVGELNPIIRGWVSHYRLVEVKSHLEELNAWFVESYVASCGGSGRHDAHGSSGSGNGESMQHAPEQGQ